MLYAEDFETDLLYWVVEQGEGGTAEIINGQLDIVDEKGCTIWFKHKLESPVMIEYEAVMTDSGGRHDRVSDLNCFWMAIDPEHDLRDPEFMLKGNTTMKIQLIADGNIIQYWRDGELIYNIFDEDPYLEGWFGFRTVRSHLRLDNFRVYRLAE